MGNIELLSRAIKEIIELKGTSVFENPRVFCAMMDDLVPELEKERRIFRSILNDDVMSEIGRLYAGTSVGQNISWSQIKLMIMEDYGFQEEWCDIVIHSFSGVFDEENYSDYKEETEQKQQVSKVEFNLEKIQRQLEMLKWTPFGNLDGSPINYDESHEKALEWFKKAAEQGNVSAQYYLGVMYEFGIGTKKNHKIALEWFEKAMDQGYDDAAYNVGCMHFIGWLPAGVPPFTNFTNHEIAFAYFKTAAERGQVNAQYMLGNMYYYGNGINRDYKKALEWYEKAAKQGHAQAQNTLGDMYAHRKGTKRDYGKALQWYGKAAEQGYDNAQYNLGYMYEHGKGTKRDSRIAYEWYLKAADQGHPFAKRKVQKKSNAE